MLAEERLDDNNTKLETPARIPLKRLAQEMGVS
jgi:hypothetical protein